MHVAPYRTDSQRRRFYFVLRQYYCYTIAAVFNGVPKGEEFSFL